MGNSYNSATTYGQWYIKTINFYSYQLWQM